MTVLLCAVPVFWDVGRDAEGFGCTLVHTLSGIPWGLVAMVTICVSWIPFRSLDWEPGC